MNLQRRAPYGTFSPPYGRRLWTWVAAGGAVVSLGLGIGVTASAASDYDEYQTTPDPERFDLLAGRIEDKRIVFGVMYGVAGALAVTSAVLYWLEGRSLEHGPRATSIEPLLGRGFAGARLRARF